MANVQNINLGTSDVAVIHIATDPHLEELAAQILFPPFFFSCIFQCLFHCKLAKPEDRKH